ncbi:MAG: thiamine pyrophosphate-dependent enzyme [Chloroflexota bacterium]|nr:thiamine pyrophosphate-dependent enzyme [Chloroflexota bacterium]
MIDGNRVMEIFAEYRDEQVVVTTMSSAKGWPRHSERPELDLPLRGCMGKASSLGLGIALARPERKVVVLDGDGSLLMNLGSLVTAAGMAPQNFLHVVLEGRTYDTSGGQPTPNQGKVDFAGLARAAGYARAETVDDEAGLHTALSELTKAEGPSFLCVRVNSMWATGSLPGRAASEIYETVATALAAG